MYRQPPSAAFSAIRSGSMPIWMRRLAVAFQKASGVINAESRLKAAAGPVLNDCLARADKMAAQYAARWRRLAARPARRTKAKIMANCSKAPRPAADEVRQHGRRAATSPMPNPSTRSKTFSMATSIANVPAGKPAVRSRANSPRRSKTFRHCTTASPIVPNNNPSPPRLWNVERYVFCTAAKAAEPLDGRFGSETVIAQFPLQCPLDRGRFARRGLDEEVTVTDRGRIVMVKIVLAHQQVALEDAVFQQPGDLEIEGATVGVAW